MSDLYAVVPALLEHARDIAPRECCGLAVKAGEAITYRRCRNIASGNEHFAIDPADYAAAEDLGEVVAVCHSHVNVQPTPSMADRVACEKSGVPWVIVGYPNGAVLWLQPTNYQAPLVGREWSHGVLDCYTLIQDYYSRELGIALPDFERAEEWWDQPGQDLYRENFEAAGFEAVARDEGPGTIRPERHDVILMQIRSKVPNHAAVYLGDGRILHHFMRRLSTREVYGGMWAQCARILLRHRQISLK